MIQMNWLTIWSVLVAQQSDALEIVAKCSGHWQRQRAAQGNHRVLLLGVVNLCSNCFDFLFASAWQIRPGQATFQAKLQNCVSQAFEVASSAAAQSIMGPNRSVYWGS